MVMKKSKQKFVGGWILILVTLLMIIITAVQAYQLIGLQSQVLEISESLKEYKPVTSTLSSSGSGSTSLLQQNLQNLPSMVGGC